MYKSKNTFLYLLFTIFFISLPLFTPGIHHGHDLHFHIMRIEAIAQELKDGYFPARLGNIYFGGYGYPTSIYYGDILLYLPAILRICNIPVISSYKIYILIINIGSSIIGYSCFKSIFNNQKIAIITNLVYLCSTYRFVNLYIRSAVGEYSAMMFLPIVVLAIYKIYTTASIDRKTAAKIIFLLSLGMSGLVLTHILTTIMTIFFLLAIALIFFRITFQKNIFRIYILSIVATILLTAFFIIPMFDYYLNIEVFLNTSTFMNFHLFVNRSIDLNDIFAFFSNIFGYYDVNNRLHLCATPGLCLVLTLITVPFVGFNGNKQIQLLTFLSIFSLILTTNIFPWSLINIPPINKFFASVQFPWRFMGFAILFLSLLLGTLLIVQKRFSIDHFLILIFIYALISSSIYTGQYDSSAIINSTKDNKELAPYNSDYLYLLTNINPSTGQKEIVDTNALTGHIHSENLNYISIILKKGHHWQIECEVIDSANGYIEIPVFNYKGYRVNDTLGNSYKIVDGKNKEVAFFLPSGFNGTIEVDFLEPWYWRCSELISIFTLIYLLLYNPYYPLLLKK